MRVETYTMRGKYYFVIRDRSGKMIHSSKLFNTRKQAQSAGKKYKKR